jgi:hypothetical protein
MKLSNQALGTIMMALQKSIITQCDITDTLKELNFILNEKEELQVENPPTFEVPNSFYQNVEVGSD